MATSPPGPHSSRATVRSTWSNTGYTIHTGASSAWQSDSEDAFSMASRPIEEVEAAHLRRNKGLSVDEFPWISSDNFEPIRTEYTSTQPPDWFREGQARNLARGYSTRSARSLRESIVDLHLVVSDLDYYAGAVHDYQYHAGEDDDDWDEEEGGDQSEWPLPADSDGATFGQIQIIRGGTPRGPSVKRGPSKRSLKGEKDINLVTWDGPDDPENPKNWPRRTKWAVTITVSLFTFISPVSSSMIAPAVSNIEQEFGVKNKLVGESALSVFILAFAVGPLFLGPLSELFGRKIVLQLSNLFYFGFNLACGFSENIAEVIVFRFLSGLGGSAPLGIGGGILGDVWLPHERGKAMAFYSLMPLLGPALGPVAGGFIAQYTTWRWVFYSTSIGAMLVQVLGVFFLRETYAPELLKRKKKQLIRLTGNPELRTEFDGPSRKMSAHLRTAFARPFRLLGTQPIVQILSLYIGFVYGVLYLVLGTFPILWEQKYGMSKSIGGLNYLSLGLGFWLGTQIAAKTADRIYKRLKASNGNKGRSEFRVPLMFPGAVMVPLGLLLYGWSAQYRVFWLVPDIGAALFAAGNQLVFQNCQTYIVDAYTKYAASAIAATTVFRSLGGFAFPLFAPAMYQALGWGWGNTVLAISGVVIGLPAPCILWFYGERLRQKSQFAAG